MNNKIFYKLFSIILLSSLVTLQSCIGKSETKVSISRKTKQKEYFPSSLVSVNIANNLMTINGTGFSPATVVSIKKDGVETPLTINSKSNTQLVTSSVANLSLLLNSAFDLIIGTAEAQAVYSLTFTLDNNSIALTKLSNTGASPGQVIKYNGTNWAAAALNEPQNYQGTWNATTNLPDLTIPSSTPGDYYIVATAGTYSAVTYAVGDWIISDGAAWQKVPIANTLVTSFQGRTGIVTLLPADYVSLKDGVTQKVTGSKLTDIADIDISTPQTSGQVLKWNAGSSKWVPGDVSSSGAAIALGDLSASSPLSYNNTTGVFTLPTANVLALPLTGLASGTGAVVATDTILAAFGKLMSVPSDYVSKASGNTLTGATIISGIGSSLSVPTPLITDYGFAANVQYVNDQIAGNGVWSKGAASTINYTAGNVGIGTVTPTSLLHLHGAGAKAAIYSSDAANDYGVNIGTAVSTGNLLNIGDNYAAVGAANKFIGITMSTIQPSGHNQGGYIGVLSNAINYTTPHMVFGQRTGGGGAVYLERMRIDRDGNVGIGTMAPANKLSVTPVQYSTGTASQANTTVTGVGTTWTSAMVGSQLVFANGVSAGTITAFGSTTSLTVSTSQTVNSQAYSIAYTGLQVGSTGNVGVGTTAPSDQLHLQKAAGNPTIILDSVDNSFGIIRSGATTQRTILAGGPSATSANGAYIQSTGTSYAATVGYKGIIALSAGNVAGPVSTDGSIMFMTAGSGIPRMIVDRSGFVGIGTAVPANKLSVSPVQYTTGTASQSTTTVTGLGTTWTAAMVGSQLFFADGVSAGTITAFGSTTSLTVSTSQTVLSQAYTISYTGLQVGSTGNVGIGTTNPGTALEVAGAATIQGLTVGKGLNAVATNTALGVQALAANTTGDSNYASGYQALKVNTTGSRNTAIGLSSGLAIVNGSDNTSVGRNSLAANITGNNNSAFGVNSIGNNTGSSNSAFGTQAMQGTAGAGSWNSAFGEMAMIAINTGNSNTAIGRYSLAAVTSGSQNSALGEGAGRATTGSNNTFLGQLSGSDVTTGSNNVVIGRNTGLSIATLSNTILLSDGSGNERLRVDSSGNVGIGTDTPGFTLDVNGSIAAVGALQAHSDKRLKKNIVTVDHPLEKLLALNGVFYEWRKDEFPEIHFEGGRQMGVIAQDVEKVFPEAVTKNKAGIRSVAYTMLIAPIIETIKEFNKYFVELFSVTKKQGREIASVNIRMSTLEKENDSLKKENADMKKRLNSIEKMLFKAQ